jgi:hypothetical protein
VHWGRDIGQCCLGQHVFPEVWRNTNYMQQHTVRLDVRLGPERALIQTGVAYRVPRDLTVNGHALIRI